MEQFGLFSRAAHLAPTPEWKTAFKFSIKFQAKQCPDTLVKLLVVIGVLFSEVKQTKNF